MKYEPYMMYALETISV